MFKIFKLYLNVYIFLYNNLWRNIYNFILNVKNVAEVILLFLLGHDEIM